MNDIVVIFTGLVVLMSGSMLHLEPAGNIFAAVAVEDNAKPEEPAESVYGVVLPVHDAIFELVTNDAVVVGGTKPKRLFKVLNKDGVQVGQAVALSGDHVQFGSWDEVASRCNALFSKDSEGALPGPTFEQVPHLRRILPESKLADGTYPVDGDYKFIRAEMVSSWLDIHGGILSAKTDPGHVERDFLPTRHKQKLATEATLLFKVPKSPATCVMITPFEEAEPDLVIKLANHKHVIHFRNAARISGAALEGQIFPGVTFDFELFYRILEHAPCPPPVPHFDVEKQRALMAKLHNEHNGTETDPPEGAVCGPSQMH